MIFYCLSFRNYVIQDENSPVLWHAELWIQFILFYMFIVTFVFKTIRHYIRLEFGCARSTMLRNAVIEYICYVYLLLLHLGAFILLLLMSLIALVFNNHCHFLGTVK